jgi:hypothetical protein
MDDHQQRQAARINLVIAILALAAAMLCAGLARAACYGAPTHSQWNSADKTSAWTLSNGNLNAGNTGTAGGVRNTQGKSTGKFYWEIALAGPQDTVSNREIGVTRSTAGVVPYFPGIDSNGWGYRAGEGQFIHGGSASATVAKSNVGDTVMIAVDLDADKIWFGKNGSWLQGAPAAGTGATYSNVSGEVFPTVYASAASFGGFTYAANFGAAPFAYTVPTGFAAGWFVQTEIACAVPGDDLFALLAMRSATVAAFALLGAAAAIALARGM